MSSMTPLAEMVSGNAPRHTRKVAAGVGLVVGLVALAAGMAFGYWASTDSSNPAAAVADSLPTGATPGTPTTNGANGSTVSLSFSQASTTTGDVALTSYTVTRYPSVGGSGTVTSATCSMTSGTINCSETNVPSGTWVYTDTPKISGTAWVGTESAKSPSVTVDTTTPSASAPGVSASVTSGTSPTWVDNETVTLTDSPTDVGGTGVASVAYYYCLVSAGSCTSGTPWHSIGSSSTGPNWSVAWNTPLPSDGTYNVVAVATGDNTNVGSPSAATEVGVDTTGPVVSAPTVAAAVTYGSNPIYVNNENVTLTDTSASDAGSGVKSVAYYYCAGSSGSCSTILIGSSSTASGNYAVTWSTPLPSDGPYRIEAVATDKLTNTTTSASTLVTVDTTPPSVSTPSVNGIS